MKVKRELPQDVEDTIFNVVRRSRITNPAAKMYVVGVTADKMSDAQLYYLLSLEAQGRIEMAVL